MRTPQAMRTAPSMGNPRISPRRPLRHRMCRHDYWVYILSSLSRVLYVGVTNNMRRRLHEHKHGLVAGLTAHYNVNRFAEHHIDVIAAIAREKRVKRWHRVRKVALMEAANWGWKGLSAAWE